MSEELLSTAMPSSLKTVIPKGSDDEIWSSMSSLSPDDNDVLEMEVVHSPLPINSHESTTTIVQQSTTAILSPCLSPLTYCISGTPRNNVLRKVTSLSVDKSSSGIGGIGIGIVSSTSSSSSLSCLSEQLNFTALEKFEGCI